MKFQVHISYDFHIFSYQVFNYDFILYTYVTHIAASTSVIDNFIN